MPTGVANLIGSRIWELSQKNYKSNPEQWYGKLKQGYNTILIPHYVREVEK